MFLNKHYIICSLFINSNIYHINNLLCNTLNKLKMQKEKKFLKKIKQKVLFKYITDTIKNSNIYIQKIITKM